MHSPSLECGLFSRSCIYSSLWKLVSQIPACIMDDGVAMAHSLV